MSELAPKANILETNEILPQIRARLDATNQVVVDEVRLQDELRTKGFGEKEGQEYILQPFEALYLKYTDRLILENNPDGHFDSLFELFLNQDKNVMTKFLIYRDLRSRGYVAKDGFGFGSDFRVYDRGDYQKKPAKFVVFGMNEGTNMNAKTFTKSVLQVEKMGKEAVIAVIERRGEVIYYKASNMRFNELSRKTRSNLSSP